MFAFMVIFGRKRAIHISEGWDESEQLYTFDNPGTVEFRMYVAM